MKNPFQKAKETAQAMKNKIKNEIEECFDNEELFRRQKESKKSLQLQGGRANQQATFASTYVQKKTIKTRVHNLTSKRKCSNKRKKQDTSSGMVLNNGQIKLTTFVKSKNNIKR